jgi:hypothetical protein
MPESVRGVSQDFWRPAQAPRIGIESAFPAECCANCGTEFTFGARFCHVCGLSRGPLSLPASRLHPWAGLGRLLLGLKGLRERLGLTAPSFVLLLLAAGCALGALFVGVVYRVTTVLDWQALQAWRIEWMLGAIMALLAALLLRDSPSA